MLDVLLVLVHTLQTPQLELLHLALDQFEVVAVGQQKLSLMALDDLLDLLVDFVDVF
jgi:hypothetical protein